MARHETRGPTATGPVRRRLPAAFVLIGDQLVWGASYPATAVALRGLSASCLALIRLGVGAAVLAPWMRPPAGTRWSLRSLSSAAALGVAGYTLPVYLQIVGLARTSPALAAIFVALEPLLTALIAALALREPLPPARRAALALAALGAWATAGFPRPGAAGHIGGDLLLLLANAGFASYNAFGAPLAARMSAPSATAATLLAGCAAMLPLWWAFGAALPHHAPAAVWAAVAFLTLPGTAGAYLGWMWAVTRVPVALAALFLYLQPVVGVLLSVALTGQHPPAAFYAGAAAILAALFVGRERAPAPAEGQRPAVGA